MPYPPMNLPQELQNRLRNFVRDQDFIELYKKYNWGMDTWRNGFPNILQLEIKIAMKARNNLLKREDIMRVAEWGNLWNTKRIECPETINLQIFENKRLSQKVKENSSFFVKTLLEASLTLLSITKKFMCHFLIVFAFTLL